MWSAPLAFVLSFAFISAATSLLACAAFFANLEGKDNHFKYKNTKIQK
jgi:hypothetical protein